MANFNGHEGVQCLDVWLCSVDAFLRAYVLITKEEASSKIFRLYESIVNDDKLAYAREDDVFDGFGRDAAQTKY